MIININKFYLKMLPFYTDDRYVGLFQSQNDRWRRFRSIINPTFSPAKIKQVKLNKFFIFNNTTILSK